MTIRYLALFAPLLLGGCYGVAGHDEVDRYFQRSDSITMTAGDAKQVNAVTHTIHPWPRYVGDRRIAYDARRVGSAVTRYGNQQQPVDQLPDMGDPTKLIGQRPPVTQNVNVTGLGAGASAGVSVPVGGAGGR
ncbi:MULTISPECIES: hypothetical protein [Bradyrhizobium]|jgi:hypothetical protein|uniref:Uncharacterized protein n=1 Tax=Bradyrhizobium ottawaense TaxID=931866 RepID=A0A2U8PA46_9BRAD|nr:MULTISPECIES: hypothetical protein [Bradyrhizobium]AWL94632.1 hypothetical protein CIT37_22570 [Bradyrhizobium ottawaense]MBR1329404.1 hypothetical protein [Bradyrhizobium ottawaense]MBR1335644.1 hypothetical protein [Bradyrhizobium ottawaense]MBR1363131.1 hypothetical protein [Bradyrhizobium ottawaense]MDA9445594.1 hypothetical protein [Bradyrhizobium sp. CCBAU 21360]